MPGVRHHARTQAAPPQREQAKHRSVDCDEEACVEYLRNHVR
jgi:hypothetical protein